MSSRVGLVVGALEGLRLVHLPSEYAVHERVAACLAEAGLEFEHEVLVGPRRRIDFLCGKVGIEVKRGKPTPARLSTQLAAYAASPLLDALVLVVERNVTLPPVVSGKPLIVLSLNRLWGVALP